MENPSAFPGQPHGSDGLPSCEASPGMTLRDWFAGQALMQTSARPQQHGMTTIAVGSPMHPAKAAADAYRYADAMLAERAKAQP